MSTNRDTEKKMITEDTIAAIATAPGNGGIGIIRISGPDAEKIMLQVFRPASIRGEKLESHRMYYGWIADDDGIVDECMAVIMRAPRSYTRENVAELQIHGGSYVLNRSLQICLSRGARLAMPGEFTRRAFLNGRIDLSRAEAVMSIINARGAQEHKAAVRQMNGGPSSFIRTISDELYDLQAGLAACIDYPEEITEEEGAGILREGLKKVITRLEKSIDEHASRMIYQGLHVAIIGCPNVGKSSLLNALLEEERAIVTNIPGTTRDTINGELILNGVRIRLTDTAGIRETADPVEKLGVERSSKALTDADAALLVLDGSEALSIDELKLLEMIHENDAVIVNKTDLARKTTEKTIRQIRPDVFCISLSAHDPSSLQPLREYLSKLAEISDQITLTQPRHLDAARRAVKHLKDAFVTLNNFTPDLAATDLQAAQAALSEITGDHADEILLDHIFSQFCVGK